MDGAEDALKVAVLSDSHVSSLDALPPRAIDVLLGADWIVHAGDYTGKRLLDALRNLGNFTGVYGNIDPPAIRQALPPTDVLEVEGVRIAVTHPAEGGAPFGLHQRLRSKFEHVDVIVYGHSHQTHNAVRHGIRYFNPGSVTGRFPARQKTLGILTIGKTVKGQIIKV